MNEEKSSPLPLHCIRRQLPFEQSIQVGEGVKTENNKVFSKPLSTSQRGDGYDRTATTCNLRCLPPLRARLVSQLLIPILSLYGTVHNSSYDGAAVTWN